MATRTQSSSSPILMAVLVIVTFPIWIALGGAFIGVIAGLFGAAVGIMGAIFGICVAIIALPFKILFGWGDWGWHGFHPFHHTGGFMILCIIVIAALLVTKGRVNKS